MGIFGIIKAGISKFGNIIKSGLSHFGNIGGKKEEPQQADYPNVPVKGYEPHNHPDFKPKGMVDKARERYGGVHINPNGYHLPGLHNIH
jgi:hypothetical protein